MEFRYFSVIQEESSAVGLAGSDRFPFLVRDLGGDIEFLLDGFVKGSEEG